jgi:hypothetical protein
VDILLAVVVELHKTAGAEKQAQVVVVLVAVLVAMVSQTLVVVVVDSYLETQGLQEVVVLDL